MRLSHKDDPEGWRCDALTCREENSEAFAGLHAADSTAYYLFDEASAVPDVIYDVAEGGMTDGEPMHFLWGNPTRNVGRFREIFGKFRHRWITRQIDSRDAKMPNKAKRPSPIRFRTLRQSADRADRCWWSTIRFGK